MDTESQRDSGLGVAERHPSVAIGAHARRTAAFDWECKYPRTLTPGRWGSVALHPGARRADTASMAAMTPKDRRLFQVGSLVSVAAVLMALGGGLVGTTRPLGIALLILGFVVLQAAWIPSIRRNAQSKK